MRRAQQRRIEYQDICIGKRVGQTLRIVLTAGQCSDLDGADRFLLHLRAGVLIADKGYDAYGRVVKPLLDSGKQVVIPSLRNRKQRRKYNSFLYCRRHLIENFFAHLKQYRALAARYDKTAVAFWGSICLPAAISWIK